MGKFAADQLGEDELLEAKLFIESTHDMPCETRVDEKAMRLSPYLIALNEATGIKSIRKRRIAEAKREISTAAESKDLLIRSNLRLVVSIARKYPQLVGMELDDSIQEGNLGLDHGIGRFDWSYGTKLSTYATDWIRNAIRAALDAKGSTIHISQKQNDRLRSALKLVDGDPEKLDPENSKIYKFRHSKSLDKKLGEDTDTTIGDLIPDTNPNNMQPEDVVDSLSNQSIAQELLDHLDPEARTVVELYMGFHGEPLTFKEIGEIQGVSKTTVGKILTKAIAQLQKHAELYGIAI